MSPEIKPEQYCANRYVCGSTHEVWSMAVLLWQLEYYVTLIFMLIFLNTMWCNRESGLKAGQVSYS